MKTRTLDRNEILQTAEMYEVPAECAKSAKEMTCSGGYGYTILNTTKGPGHQGCGHFRCELCDGQAADGIVGDDAIIAFYGIWLEKALSGKEIPRRVTGFIARSIARHVN